MGRGSLRNEITEAIESGSNLDGVFTQRWQPEQCQLRLRLGHKQIDHGGAWQGFRCHILRYPDDGVSVVVLANADSARPEQFAHVIAGIVNPALVLPKLV